MPSARQVIFDQQPTQYRAPPSARAYELRTLISTGEKRSIGYEDLIPADGTCTARGNERTHWKAPPCHGAHSQRTLVGRLGLANPGRWVLSCCGPECGA